MKVFTKQNVTPYHDALLKEADGLATLTQCLELNSIQELNVPEVISVSEQSLRISLIQSSSPSREHMETLGLGLAKMHAVVQEAYGYPSDNYIGLNPQMNEITHSWGTFFVDRRLGFQLSLINNALMRDQLSEQLAVMRQPLIQFLDQHCHHASLVHGDLWSGNVLFSQDKVWLIDPAVYYADREVDVAMTEIFGGFTSAFYSAYESVYPLSEAYEHKKLIYNLYHFLNHYNLFGESYLQSCLHCFKEIGYFIK